MRCLFKRITFASLIAGILLVSSLLHSGISRAALPPNASKDAVKESAAPVAIFPAKLSTRSGKNYEGNLDFAPGNVAVVTPVGGGAAAKISLADLASLEVQLPPRAIELPTTLPAASSTQPAAASDPTGRFAWPSPASWRSQDIGRCIYPGSASVKDGTLTIKASGWGMWGPADSCHFVYLPISGDWQIIAHVASLESDRGMMLAGVGARESLSPSANEFSALASPGGEVRSRERPPFWAPKFNAEAVTPYKVWIRLARSGDQISTYQSTNGLYWDATPRRKFALADNVYLGVVACTRVNSFLETAVFDHVVVVPGLPDMTCFPGSENPVSGIVLRDGTVYTGQVMQADGTHVTFMHGDMRRNAHGDIVGPHQNFVIPIEQVAALLFHTTPPDYLLQLTQPGPSAMLLASGDQIEATLDHVTGPTVTINSVMVGLKDFSINQEAVAMRLNQLTPPEHRWLIRLRDGSRFYVTGVKTDAGGLLVEHSVFGKIRIAPAEVAEIVAPQ